MKPFIYSSKKDENTFEGNRLRKNLKGALELANINYVLSFVASPDIVHFYFPVKDSIINEAKENNAKIVTSALYFYDNSLSFVEFDKNTYKLTKIGIKTLNASDLILVPTIECKNYLENHNIKKRIEVLTPGINLSRFDYINDIENEIFSKYVGLQNNQKYIITVGDCEDILCLSRLSYFAKIHQNFHFFYFIKNSKHHYSYHYRKHLSKIYGDNISFYQLPEDDIYRSAIHGASAYLSLSMLPDYLYVLDAMSAKVPVFEILRPIFGNVTIDKKTGFVQAEIENLSKSFYLWCQNKQNSTIIEAYEFIKSISIKNLGKELTKEYLSIIDKQGDKND